MINSFLLSTQIYPIICVDKSATQIQRHRSINQHAYYYDDDEDNDDGMVHVQPTVFSCVVRSCKHNLTKIM